MTRRKAATAPAPAPARKRAPSGAGARILQGLLAAGVFFLGGCWVVAQGDDPRHSILPALFVGLAFWVYAFVTFRAANGAVSAFTILGIVVAFVIVGQGKAPGLGENMAKVGGIIPSSSDSGPPAKGHGK